MASFEEAVLRSEVAKICDHVGYHAITKESAAILVDLYIRTFVHLARHCKEKANHNRRVEPTLVDLIQALDFVGISVPDLKEHAESVKIQSLDYKIERDTEVKPSNRIQRHLFVDDLLEAEKNNGQLEDNDEGGENRAANEQGEDEDKNMTPLLRDIYQEISNQYPSPSKPIKAEKARIKREEKPVIPKLKITPLDPSIAEPPSFLPILENANRGDLASIPPAHIHTLPPLSEKSTKGRKKAVKIQKTKIQKRGRKPNSIKPTKPETSPKRKAPSPVPSTPSPLPPPPPPPPPPAQASRAKIKIETPKQPEESSVEESPVKQAKKEKKKKKRSSNQFAIETETVTAADEEGEWLCPTCNGPDNGDLMVGCDVCDLWYHLRCSMLKKPPKDDEKWACIKCRSETATTPDEIMVAGTSRNSGSGGKKQSSKGRKRAQVDLSESPIKKTKTPEPTVQKPPTPVQQPLPPPPPPPPTPPVAAIVVEEPQQNRPTVICSSQDDLCPECQLPDDGTLMIQCDDPFCARWFHGKCVGVLEEPKDDDSWFCKACVEKQASAFKRRRRPI